MLGIRLMRKKEVNLAKKYSNKRQKKRHNETGVGRKLQLILEIKLMLKF